MTSSGTILAPMLASLAPAMTATPMFKSWQRAAPGGSDQSTFVIIIELEAGNARRFAVVQGRGVYPVTAALLSNAAIRLATEGPKGKGVLSPSQALDAQWLLQAAGLEVQVADA